MATRLIWRGRLAVGWIAFMACFPGALLLIASLGESRWLLNSLLLTVVVTTGMVDGPLIAKWAEETRQPEYQRYIGPFTSAFTRYSLQTADLQWPWFNPTRLIVLTLGTGAFAVGYLGALLGLWR